MLTKFRWLGDTVINYRLPIPSMGGYSILEIAFYVSSATLFVFFRVNATLSIDWTSVARSKDEQHDWKFLFVSTMQLSVADYRFRFDGCLRWLSTSEIRLDSSPFGGRFHWFEVPAWLAHEHHVAPDIGLNKRPPSEHLLPTNFFIQLRVYKSSGERRAPAYLRAPTKVQELPARTHNCVPCPHRLPGKNTEF